MKFKGQWRKLKMIWNNRIKSVIPKNHSNFWMSRKRVFLTKYNRHLQPMKRRPRRKNLPCKPKYENRLGNSSQSLLILIRAKVFSKKVKTLSHKTKTHPRKLNVLEKVWFQMKFMRQRKPRRIIFTTLPMIFLSSKSNPSRKSGPSWLILPYTSTYTVPTYFPGPRAKFTPLWIQTMNSWGRTHRRTWAGFSRTKSIADLTLLNISFF